MRGLLSALLLLIHVGQGGWGELRAPTPVSPSRVRIRVEKPREGAPILLGLPFPKGALQSPDHVRVLAPDGREVPSQINEVSTWEPADESVKWLWVFFFAERSEEYVLEYGPTVRRADIPPSGRLEVVNNQGEKGFAQVTTGPLRFLVRKGEGGFLHRVQLDLKGDGFQEEDVIAEEPLGRGSFLDLLDDLGLDPSRAVITRTVIEKGSGPLHAVVRVQGEYRYARADNHTAPFVLRIHAYAGKSYVRVFHTFVYTGVPDKHRPQPGEHAHVATQGERIRREEPGDPGWTQPNDRVAAVGLSLDVKLRPKRQLQTTYREGRWWEEGSQRVLTRDVSSAREVSLLQSGPKPTRLPPVPESSPDRRLEGFFAQLDLDGRMIARAERAEGWLSLSDDRWGLALGVRNVLEEYPKEIRLEMPGPTMRDRLENVRMTAFLWPPRVEPMSFARWSSELEYEDGAEGTVENWAQGLAKTSELIFFFHRADASREEIERTMSYVLDPPVAHADPSWYAASGVYGRFAPRTERFPALERALDYKFQWWLFNQRWVPWFGMFDYGDGKMNFDGERWDVWVCNEPAVDFMLWLHFLRTGDRRLYLAAEAASRHAMDVDNTHWPTDPTYYGDTNSALDFWLMRERPPGTKYLGIGRRHGMQHWSRALSAHVWVAGWLASYYLAGYHRGLDVALQTAETYLKRIWGEHDLTGRRLYLSVWNLVEVWDATKDERYHRELKERIARMLWWQEREQGGSLVMDRYGYAQNYASHGLGRYLDLTGDRSVRAALIRHARRVRDVPPLSHRMESYLATLHSLVLGYDLTGEPSFLEEVKRRLDVMQVDALPRPIDDSWTQRELFQALERVSHLPRNPDGSRPLWSLTHGLRVFGWTHAYGLPYALRVLAEQESPAPPNRERSER